jgi:hypothetical protein
MMQAGSAPYQNPRMAGSSMSALPGQLQGPAGHRPIDSTPDLGKSSVPNVANVM